MKNLAFLSLILFCVTSTRADILFLNSGDELNGALTGMTADSVSISVKGEERTLSRKDVLKIQFVKEYSGGGADPLKDAEAAGLLPAPPAAADYPNDGYIHWLRAIDITVNPDRSWTVSKHGLRYVLRERGKSPAAYLDHKFLPALQTVQVEHAYSLVGATASYLTDVSVMEGAPNTSYPSYDRLRLIKYAIPNVQIGSVLGYRSRVDTVYVSTYPLFSDYALRLGEPVRTFRLSVTVPAPLKLSYHEFNLPENVKFSRMEKGGAAVYTWLAEDLPSYRYSPRTPPFFRYAPQVLLSLDNGSWDELRSTLKPLIEERLVITPAMKAKAQELTSGSSSEEEKAETVYNWIAREIKYQPVPPGSYSYLPRPSDEIFDSKAGNALDKPFLLYAMLQAAGLEPGFAYVRSKQAPFSDKLVNVRQFDHAECLLKTAGGRLLPLAPLDDTHRYTELSPQLQGMPAFRALGNGTALFTNPDFPAEREADRTEASYVLSAKGDLSGSYTKKLSGSPQAGMRGYKDYKKEDLDKAMEKLAHSIHPQARLKNYRLDNLSDLSKDLDFSLKMEAPGYAMKAGKYMIFKVPGLVYSAFDAAETERDLPLFWYSRSLSSSEVKIKLPKGYRLYHAPKDLNLKKAGESYTASFRTSKRTLTFSEEYRLDNTWIPPADYPQYKAFKEALAQLSESWIVLKKD